MARSSSSSVAASGTATDATPGRSLALHLLFSLRPVQWSKNLVIFAGLLVCATCGYTEFYAADPRALIE